ncbi:MAG: nicotinate-nicotinamide nucleotide adenylyltransferase [Lactovum sp.]
MTVELLTPFTKVKLQQDKEIQKGGIAFFWGTFNPVHLAHLLIADQVRQLLKLDEVRFLPEKASSDVLEMLALVTDENLSFKLEEARCQTRLGIYETIKKLKEKSPEKDLYFILGADMIASLSRWPDIDELVKLVTIVGIQRPRYRAGTSYPVLWLDCPQLDISSFQIREMIKKGIEPNFLLAPKVLSYIKERNLYREDDGIL